MQSNAPTISASDLKEVSREPKRYMKSKDGDLRGPDFTIRKGNFANYMGYKKPTQAEKEGQISGRRSIEVALQNTMGKVTERAAHEGAAYRNFFISMGRYSKQPGRFKEMARDGLDAIKHGLEDHGNMNENYLLMQFKSMSVSRSYSTVSNLMKVRHEAVKKTISEVK